MTLRTDQRRLCVIVSSDVFAAIADQAAQADRAIGNMAAAILSGAVGHAPSCKSDDRMPLSQKAFLRRTVSSMKPIEYRDYRTFLGAGFRASEAVEKVLRQRLS